MHTLKVHLRHTDKWKEELQDHLKTTRIIPQKCVLILYVINCFATNTDCNISRDCDDLIQAICFDQNKIWWKTFLQGKLLQYWIDIISTEREQLGLPPNLWEVPQTMKALITKTLNLWRTRYEFLHGEINSNKFTKTKVLDPYPAGIGPQNMEVNLRTEVK